MAQSPVIVPPNSTGAHIDTWLTGGGNNRQSVVIGDPSTDANVVAIPATGKLPIQTEVQLDYDTSAGTQNLSLHGIALPASGGAVAGGTAANPLKVDPTGTTTQPISGTVAISGTPAVTISGTATVSGTVVVSSITAPVSISGTVPISGTITTSDPDAATSDYHAVSGGSTNTANIKASTGKVFGVHVFNNAAYPVYVKLHNSATTPTAGAGVVNTTGVQAGTQRDVIFPKGFNFAAGIGISIVKGIADSDATAILINDCVVDVDFK